MDSVAHAREDVTRGLSRPEPWAVAVGLGAIVVARWLALGTPSARGLAGGLLTVVGVAVVVGASLVRDRSIAASAVLLASSATVIAASSDGRWQGGIALLVVLIAAWSDRREIALALALVSVIGFVLWWRSGFARGAAPGPSWPEVFGETGAIVRRSVSSVGPDELLVPMSGVMVWWVGVGIVVGAALVSGRVGRASWVPVTVFGLVAGVWAIRGWRGSVDPVGGTWIVAMGIVVAAARTGGQEAFGEHGEDRISAMVTMTAGFVLAVAFASELRHESTFAAVVAVTGAVLVGVSFSLSRLVPWLSGRDGA